MSFVRCTRSSFLKYTPITHAIEQGATLRVIPICNPILSRRGQRQYRHFARPYSSSAQSPLHNLRERSTEQGTLVFQSTSNNPYHNLAIEHYLLTHSDVDSHILFFYTNRPCVVIGRNQNPWTECNLTLIQDGIGGKSIDLVRRRSGGGTVFHDEGNLNFSVIVPNDKDFTRRKHAELVVRALNEIHVVSAEYDGPENIWVNDRHDITMLTMHNKARSEFKVSGSAFKLTRGRALHHGTLLHSSPNLHNISRLLRSTGREWIQAKGVESVRSPVMNLFNVHTVEERDEIRSQITSEIVKEFLKFYNGNASIDEVGDHDCRRDINPEVADGVDELVTDEWRFEQTPGFEFSSKIIDGRQLTFTVKHGRIEDPRLGPTELSVEQRTNLATPKQRIHEIQDWCNAFDPGTVDDIQLTTVAQVFPNLQKILYRKIADSSVNTRSAVQEQAGIVRRLHDGSVEIETGLNTVEEIGR